MEPVIKRLPQTTVPRAASLQLYQAMEGRQICVGASAFLLTPAQERAHTHSDAHCISGIILPIKSPLVSALTLGQIRTLLQWVYAQQGHVTRIDCALDD